MLLIHAFVGLSRILSWVFLPFDRIRQYLGLLYYGVCLKAEFQIHLLASLLKHDYNRDTDTLES